MIIDSHYECCEISQQYVIAEVRTFGIKNGFVYLIQDRESGKYNVYVLESEISSWPRFEKFIVQNFEPLGIDIARFCFPHFALNDSVYGF